MPQLFQPNLLCAGYESSQHGSCQGDSGGPLMVYNTNTSQYFQLGMVSGGVSSCGDKEIPGYYTRLDFPEIAHFIQDPENFIMNRGNLFIKSFLSKRRSFITMFEVTHFYKIYKIK